MNKRTIIFILVFLAILMPLLVLATKVEYGLETAFPQFTDDQGQLVAPGGGPVSWVRWIFFLALGLVGVTAVGSLIYAGIVWMTSTSEEKTKDAKARILSAIVGVLLVIGSVLLLQTINPDLTQLRNPTLDPSIFQDPFAGVERKQVCLDASGRVINCPTSEPEIPPEGVMCGAGITCCTPDPNCKTLGGCASSECGGKICKPILTFGSEEDSGVCQ